MFTKLRILTASFVLFISTAACADLAIITHPSSDTGKIDILNVRKLFLGERKSFPNGVHAIPINHVVGSPDRKEFFSSVLNMPESNHTRHWQRKISKGTGHSPTERDSYEAVLKSVANTPGSISYIDSSKVNNTVKVLLTISGFDAV
ncbi:MAG: phosphate ABC transporter substrate-binding protein [Gammaproteobacteria bacterium]|nr:phosphate ABC transporter substrate-binding protein [Gammaproteobacteria bacterium]